MKLKMKMEKRSHRYNTNRPYPDITINTKVTQYDAAYMC